MGLADLWLTCGSWEARKHKVVAVLHEMLQQFDVVLRNTSTDTSPMETT